MQTSRKRRFKVNCVPLPYTPKPPRNPFSSRMGEMYYKLIENPKKVKSDKLEHDKLTEPLRSETEVIRQRANAVKWEAPDGNAPSESDAGASRSSWSGSDSVNIPSQIRDDSRSRRWSDSEDESVHEYMNRRQRTEAPVPHGRSVSTRLRALLARHGESVKDYSTGSESVHSARRDNRNRRDRKKHRKVFESNKSRQVLPTFNDKSENESSVPSSHSSREDDLKPIGGPAPLNEIMNPGKEKEKEPDPPSYTVDDMQDQIDFLFAEIKMLGELYPKNAAIKALGEEIEKPDVADVNLPLEELVKKRDYIQKRKDRAQRRSELEESIDGNKAMLAGGCMLIEMFATEVAHLPLAGFAKQQVTSNKYKRILLDMSKKSFFKKKAKSYPPLVQLVLAMSAQALMFLMMKTALSGSFGNHFMGGMAAASGSQGTPQVYVPQPPAQTRPPPSATESPPPATRMRGPRYSAEEIDAWDDGASAVSAFTDMQA